MGHRRCLRSADRPAAGRIRGYVFLMRIGNVEIRPLGGGLGCLLMILGSIVLSVLLTIALNLLIHQDLLIH
jgi:hypothetical protein